MSDDRTHYLLGRRECRRGCRCSECTGRGCGRDSEPESDRGLSVIQRTLNPTNMVLNDNQDGISIILARWGEASQVVCQFQGFTGEMTKTVPALTINLKLDDAPIFTIANVVALVTDGEAQPGILKFGGPCSIRLYKLRGYQGGASRRFLNRGDRDQCSTMFRSGEEVSMQGNSTTWITRRFRRR